MTITVAAIETITSKEAFMEFVQGMWTAARSRRRYVFVVALIWCSLASMSPAASYKYKRLGSQLDAQTHTDPGIAMMGGGTDQDEAFRWLCGKGYNGDFLVVRARGKDDYNKYVNKLCRMNSVATLIVPDRNAAEQPRVADIVRKATVIFIAGGDQSNYVKFWKGTLLGNAINNHVLAGKPIGGTSAGLAVLGQFVYACLEDKPNDPDLTSREVLENPYNKRVTLVRDFLEVPLLGNILTDSHFAKRDRMGRSLGFLARIVQDGWSKAPREIAIDEKSALLVEVDGRAKVVGAGQGVYFLQVTDPPEVSKPGQPLTLRNVAAYHEPTGATFDIRSWTGEGGEAYSISVEAGHIRTSRPENAVY
ncbi:MAG: cyanophycinase [Candidatus Sulfotelmatobacter sp.]